MLQGILFFDSLSEKIGETLRDVTMVIDKKINKSFEGIPCRIDRKEIIKVLPSEIEDIVLNAITNELVAIRFFGYGSNTIPYINWVTSIMSQAEQQFGCLVAIKIKDYYVRYFLVDSIEREIRVIAAGTDALDACQYVQNEVLKFDTKIFDSDGYRL